MKNQSMSNQSRPQIKPGKLSKIRRADPEFAREVKKYEHPLPSREYILQTIAEQGVPASFERLCELLDVAAFEHEPFRRRLGAMARDAQLLQNRRDDWLIPDKADLLKGRVQGHADGFGFLVREDKGPDLFLSEKEMAKALHGDHVIARIVGMDRKGRPEGKIVEVTERANQQVVGRVFEEHGVYYVVAENKRISQDILIAPPEKGDRKALRPKAGQVVMIEIIEQPSKQSQPIGRVIEILGNYADPGMEIEIALRKHELPFEFSKDALAETKKIPDAVRKSDWKGREDLTQLPLVTIDGETAKDFDDAVYCERQGKGYRLIVAIADVSHYVADGSALDKESQERGNSVYFPRRVIPMLPEKLSNGLCSLNPQVERLCMVCDMAISATGVIKQYRFYAAVMWSHARLTYTEVAAALYDKDKAALAKIGALLPWLENLDALYRVLAKARSKRGAIDFETVETRMVFDDHGKIERIEPYERNDAHRIIEECMLAANVCASDFLKEREHPALYRVHEGPTPERLVKLRDFLGTFGLQLGGGDEPHAKDYAALHRQDRQPAGQAAAADRDAALAAAGDLQPGQRRPFRAGLRELHALHLADPPLSRPLDPPRHKVGAGGTALRHTELGTSGIGMFGYRTPRRRCDTRRRSLAQMLVHAGSRRRSLHRQHLVGGALRHLRRARHSVRRRPRACFRSRPRLLPLRRKSPCDGRRTHRRALPPVGPRARATGAR